MGSAGRNDPATRNLRIGHCFLLPLLLIAAIQMDSLPSTMREVIESSKVPDEILSTRYNTESTLTVTVSANGPKRVYV